MADYGFKTKAVALYYAENRKKKADNAGLEKKGAIQDGYQVAIRKRKHGKISDKNKNYLPR